MRAEKLRETTQKIGHLGNLKWWQATIMITVILVAAGYAISQGVNVYVNNDLAKRLSDYENRARAIPGQPASYIISTDRNGDYCANNGTTGQIDEQSTNASQIFTDAFNNLTSGGEIFVKCGSYLLDTPLSIPTANKGISLIGESSGWNYSNNMGATLAPIGSKWTTSTCMITANAQWFWMENIGMYGQNETGAYTNGLNFVNWDCHITNCAIAHCRIGISCKGNTWIENNWIEYNTLYDCKVTLSEYVWVLNNMFYSLSPYPAYSLAIGPLSESDRGTIWIENNRFHSAPTAIDEWGITRDMILSGNSYYNHTKYAIRIEGTVRNLEIQGDVLQGEGVTKDFLRVEATGAVNRCLISGGSIQNITQTAISNFGTVTFDIKDVSGFVTQKSGSATSCVNGTWIAHGLAGAPTTAQFEVNGTRLINATCYVVDPTIIAENSTMVQIEFLCNNNGTFNPVTATEAKTITWYFEYKP